jgi:transcription termination factor NusB
MKHHAIKTRIRARKLVLSYLYWRIFVYETTKNDRSMTQLLDLSHSIDSKSGKDFASSGEEQQALIDKMKESFGSDPMDDVCYVADFCFDKWTKDEFDMEYVFRVVHAYDEKVQHIGEAIDKHTTSFGFYDMDAMDQAVFSL